jgi:hypothetical protein
MVETRSADEALPIEGAKVTILSQDQVLAEIMTDGNGQTEKIQLKAPDKENTLSPDAPGPHYSTVEISVSKAGFVTNVIKNVPIFDGIDAYQPIDMLPETEGYPQMEVYTIPKPAVEDSSARMQQGPPEPVVSAASVMQSTPLPRPLNEVIIPDYITVHLGRPNCSKI